MPIKVQKKSGETQDFDRVKVVNGILKSGASQEEAESVIAQVETWLQTAAVNGVIQSGDLRARVLEVLRSVNPVAAGNFEAYQKPVAAVEQPTAQ